VLSSLAEADGVGVGVGAVSMLVSTTVLRVTGGRRHPFADRF
jgi:hypothetical protein